MAWTRPLPTCSCGIEPARTARASLDGTYQCLECEARAQRIAKLWVQLRENLDDL